MVRLVFFSRGSSRAFSFRVREQGKIMSEVEITDVGAIDHLRFAVPEQGGVVVLTGRNGSGKTTALNAIESAITTQTLVTPRDGCSTGHVDAFGVTLRVGRRSSRKGELEVTSLDGSVSPAMLVDPGFKSEDASDAARVKALLSLAGAVPQVSDFYDLVGTQSEFEAVIPEDLSDEKDVVALAGKVKRSLEQAARQQEDKAENETGKASAYRKGVEDLDLTAVPDPETLNQQLEEAIRFETNLKSQAVTAMRQSQSAAAARIQLARAEVKQSVDLTSDIDAARLAVNSLAPEVKLATNVVELARAELAAAQKKVDAAVAESARLQREEQIANEKLEALDQRQAESRQQSEALASAIAGWQKTIADAESIVAPTNDELDAAEHAVAAARKSIGDAAVLRRALEQVQQADAHEKAAKEATRLAIKLRDAGRGTDDVLSTLVGRCGTPLTVRDGRLFIETSRGPTRFSELSHGERWRIAIDIALESLARSSERAPLLYIPQEAWEGLDPLNRSVVVRHAQERKVVLLTAECSEGDTIGVNVH